MPQGRPPQYKPEYAEQAEKLCKIGMTDPEIGEFFGVDPATMWRWRNKYDAFRKAVTRGKEVADNLVEASLWRRATGYAQKSVKIFMPAGAESPVYAPFVEHLPPDPGAAKLWLTNRKPDQWSERSKVEHTVNLSLADRIESARKRG